MKQSDLIEIMITKRNRQSKDKKQKWVEFRSPLMLIVKGEEEKGKQKRWLTVKFGEDVDPKKLSRGYLTVVVANVSFPKVYEITKDEDGKDKYPVVWVNSYEKFRPVEVEIENPFVTDEKETEETEITDDEFETIE